MDGDLGTYSNIWEILLSRDPEMIRTAFNGLTGDEQDAVSDHLQRMVSESGWQPGQRESARAALNAISEPGEE